MPEPLTKERVLEALKRVKDPDLRSDVVSQGLVSEIVINKGKVYFAIQVDPARARELEALRVAAEKAVSVSSMSTPLSEPVTLPFSRSAR